jgi:hypothetical protein
MPHGTAFGLERIDAFRGFGLRQVRRKRVRLVASPAGNPSGEYRRIMRVA